MNHETPFEKLDRLYRTLLAPTTFLILISWNILVFIVTQSIEHPESAPAVIDPTVGLKLPVTNAAYGLVSLFFSLIIYVFLYFEKENRWVWIAKGVCFFFLFFAIFITPAIIIGPFIFASLGITAAPSEGIIPLFVILLSFIITAWLFWRAKKTVKTHKK